MCVQMWIVRIVIQGLTIVFCGMEDNIIHKKHRGNIFLYMVIIDDRKSFLFWVSGNLEIHILSCLKKMYISVKNFLRNPPVPCVQSHGTIFHCWPPRVMNTNYMKQRHRGTFAYDMALWGNSWYHDGIRWIPVIQYIYIQLKCIITSHMCH